MKRNAKGQFVSDKKSETLPEEKVYAVGFKGFGPGMVCRGKQYAENTVFEEKDAVMCKSGMHFCENPMDVLDYYPLIGNDGKPNEFATVESLAKHDTYENKSVTSKLRIGAKLDLAGFCKASFEYLKKCCTENPNESQSGNYSKQSQSGDGSKQSQSGDYSKQSQSGDYSKQSQSGYGSQQSQSGDGSKQSQSGDYSKQSQSGDGSQQSQSGYGSKQSQSGNYSQQSQSGNYSQQSQSGNYSQQSQSGDGSQQSQSGYGSKQASVGSNSSACSEGEDSLVAVLGPGGKVKGALGCVLVLAEYQLSKKPGFKYMYVIDRIISGKVDGKKIKADTWYTVKDGKFVEADND